MTDRELSRFPEYKFGQAFTTLKCECPSYLPWLEKRSVLYFKTILVTGSKKFSIILTLLMTQNFFFRSKSEC